MLASLVADRMKIARALAGAVSEAVRRRDTDHITFHGCIDWHSAVHGTWALTAYTRMTGDRRYEPLIKEILQPDKIALERTFIASRPEFEMPYGRAWFLRLAMEYEQTFAGGMLRPMAEDVLASLLAIYADRAPDPRRGSYGSDCWALINIYDYAEQARNTSALELVRELVQRHFVHYEGDCGYGLEHGHFMAVATNWAWLVSRVLEGDAFDHWVQAFFAKSGLPLAVTQPVNWHHHGLNFSRAWGLWGLAEASRSAGARAIYRDAYAAHFRASYDKPELWCGSYQGVGHWVPQFGMLALQPLFDSEHAAIV